MTEQEGVIKYRLDFTETSAPDEDLQELNCWRSILYSLEMMGQDPDRYQGYGFGNLSMRSAANPAHFIISASQTGHIKALQPEHYSRVTHVDVADNRVTANGRLPPSSESLSHAMLYQLDDRINSVIHVHHPGLWHFGLNTGYPQTAESIAFGTIEMAQAIEDLLRAGMLDQTRIVVMAGHQDGVLGFGSSIDEAGYSLLHMHIDSQP